LAKKAIDRGLLGKLVLCDSRQKYYRSPAYYKSAGWRGTWKLDGGGALMNQAVHGIDMLLWLMGDVESVFTYSGTFVRDIEVEDTSVSVVRFKNGAVGNIVGTTSVVPGQGCKTQIHGEKGSIVIGDGPLRCQIATLVKGTHKPEEIDLEKKLAPKKAKKKAGAAKDSEGVANDPKALSVRGHAIQINDFCKAIRGNRDPMVPGTEARKAVELILAIYKSWKTGKEVKLPLK
jgi:predicted dehydrogenase